MDIDIPKKKKKRFTPAKRSYHRGKKKGTLKASKNIGSDLQKIKEVIKWLLRPSL